MANLRFTHAETASFLHRVLHVAVDDTVVDILERKTEGWATGIRLAGFFLRNRTDIGQSVEALSGRSQHITDYLMSEAVHRKRIMENGSPPALRPDEFIRWLTETNRVAPEKKQETNKKGSSLHE